MKVQAKMDDISASEKHRPLEYYFDHRNSTRPTLHNGQERQVEYNIHAVVVFSLRHKFFAFLGKNSDSFWVSRG